MFVNLREILWKMCYRLFLAVLSCKLRAQFLATSYHKYEVEMFNNKCYKAPINNFLNLHFST